MMALARQRPALAIGAAALIALCFLAFLASPSARLATRPVFLGGDGETAAFGGGRPYGRDYRGSSEPAEMNRAANATLGFGKIFVVGLAERTDKRDAIALTAALTGFDVEWVDGVRGQSVPDKALPFGVDRKKLAETNLGSWRAHMNAVRRIVEERLESALIIEDDMDWDVRLKPQLERVAHGARSILSQLPSAFSPSSKRLDGRPPVSPFGDGWDVLWLGHCGEHFPEDLGENKGLATDDPARVAMSRKYDIPRDPSVPPLDSIRGLVDFRAHPEHTRWVHVTAAPICSFAYALSQRGAQRVLFDLSIDRLGGPFDNALSWLCRRAVGSWADISRAAAEGVALDDAEMSTDKGDLGLRSTCLSVTPPLFYHHRARGPMTGDSDIQTVGGNGEAREKGTTENIVWSARNNIRNMMLDRPMESQF